MEPFYKNDFVTLYHGDCVKVVQELDEKFDCMITDPPYFVLPKGKFGDDFTWDNFSSYDEFLLWTRSWHDDIMNCMKEQSCEFIFWSQKYLNDGMKLFDPSRLCFWHHSNLVNVGGMNDFAFDYEPIFVKWNGKPMLVKEGKKSCFFDYTKPQSNFKEDKLVHPTQKPIRLIEDIINMLDGVDTIIDPFAGSGTTGMAAMTHNKKCVLVEKDERYCFLIEERLKNKEKDISNRLF